MAQHYRAQVARLARILNADENRAEAADIIRSLVDRIELTPNDEGKLDIDLYGDLAGILALAANKNEPLDESGVPPVSWTVMGLRTLAAAGCSFRS
jgi:hypothetical protein